jgi:soluble P-type ATPase
MATRALFINGIYEIVLTDILEIQSALPEHVMYLQPYAGKLIRQLHDNPPTADAPVELYMSTTDRLGEVQYAAEIIAIDEKESIVEARRLVLDRVIRVLQPTEAGVFASVDGRESVNLLHVRRMRKLAEPIPVTSLVKTSDDSPIAGARATAGGWSYVKPLSEGA